MRPPVPPNAKKREVDPAVQREDASLQTPVVDEVELPRSNRGRESRVRDQNDDRRDEEKELGYARRDAARPAAETAAFRCGNAGVLAGWMRGVPPPRNLTKENDRNL